MSELNDEEVEEKVTIPVGSQPEANQRLKGWIMNIQKNIGKWQQQAFQFTTEEHDAEEADTIADVIYKFIKKLEEINVQERADICELDEKDHQEAEEKWKKAMMPARVLKEKLRKIIEAVDKKLNEKKEARHTSIPRNSSNDDRSSVYTGRSKHSSNDDRSSIHTGRSKHSSDDDRSSVYTANSKHSSNDSAISSLSSERSSLSSRSSGGSLVNRPVIADKKIGHKFPKINENSNHHRHCDTYEVEGQLPKIMIPRFDGKPEKFPEFMAVFNERVHNKAMAKKDKLFYLLQHLSGEAKEAVDGFAATAENYDKCLAILKAEYGTEDDIIFSLRKEFQNLSAPDEDYESLRQYVNKVCTNLRRLGGYTNGDEDRFVTAMIMEKLPQSWQIRYSEDYGQYNIRPTWSEVQDFLRNRLNIVKKCQRSPTNNKLKRQSRDFDRNTFQRKPQSRNHIRDNSTRSSANTTFAPKCLFCQGDHPCSACTVVESRKERLKIISDRCSNCLKKGHISKDCRSQVNCSKCKGRHHSSLCPQLFSRSLTAQVDSKKKDRSLMMATVKAKAANKETYIDAIAVFDSGSQKTYVTSQFASRLALQTITSEPVFINGFGGNTHVETSKLVSFQIQNDNGNKEILANTLKKIVNTDIEVLQDNGTKTSQQIDILIGLDYLLDFIEIPHEKHGNKIVIKSSIGNITLIADETTGSSTAMLATNTFCDADYLTWRAEYGDLTAVQSQDELQTLNFVDSTMKFEHDRYSVSIPFKKSPENLPSNFGVARGQLKGTLCRLARTPAELKEYDSIINDQLISGILEKAPYRTDGRIHYLPHHPVIKQESTTTKTRIVINCSSKISTNGVSLNDCVHQGPDLLPQLIGILLRSRTRKFIVSGDIEKAFHQISIDEDDRDFVRILWLKDINQPLSNENLVSYRFARVLFGLKTSPFLLMAVLRRHLLRSNENTEVIKNLYVDNVFIFTDNIEVAKNEKVRLKKELSEASMNLRSWFTNEKSIENEWKADEKYTADKTKILGITFDRNNDSFDFTIQINNIGIKWSPAEIMKAKLQIFDPLGLLLPAFVPVKAFLHKLSRLKHPIKKRLDKKEADEWQLMLAHYLEATKFQVQRYTGSSDPEFHELHIFSDASNAFVAAAAYIRSRMNDGSFKTTLIMAKNKVKEDAITNSDDQKIPKLELMGLVIAAEMMQKITEEIDITFAKRFLWSDSKIAIAWVKKCPAIPFVARRLPVILKERCNIGYVRTNQNPADLPTRGCTPKELKDAKIWWNGPEWLSVEEDKWPNKTEDILQPDISMQIVLISSKNLCHNVDPKFTDSLINLTRFSSFSRAVAVSKTIIKAASKFLLKIKRRLTIFGKPAKGTTSEARSLLLTFEQHKYSSVLESCKKVALRDGVYTFVDRYDNAHGIETQLPVLPKQSTLARLIAVEVHQNILHAGVAQTLANIRKHVWILKGRQLVTSMILSCPTCRRHNSKPFHLPDFPNHPTERVNAAEPFKFVGLDNFGPISTRSGEKRWGLIITCLTTRAIHLEIMSNLSVKAFIQAFSCFSSRRRIPVVVYSDNASTFRCTSDLFQNYSNDSQFSDFLFKHNIDWRFITERSPWKGGFYERLIGVVKASFRKVVGRKTLDETELRVILTELEAAVNTRPLCYVDADTMNPIRPCDFIGQTDPSPLLVPSINDDMNDPEWLPNGPATREDMLHAIKKHNSYTSNLWTKWTKEYLNALRERQATTSRNPRSTTTRNPNAGEVVIVYDDQRPRHSWELAKITRLIPSPDGIIRSAEVTTANQKRKRRSLCHLYPMELP